MTVEATSNLLTPLKSAAAPTAAMTPGSIHLNISRGMINPIADL